MFSALRNWSLNSILKAMITEPAPKEKSTEEQVSKRYHNFLDIFTKPMASQLPPHHKWDLKV